MSDLGQGGPTIAVDGEGNARRQPHGRRLRCRGRHGAGLGRSMLPLRRQTRQVLLHTRRKSTKRRRMRRLLRSMQAS